jgi:hypothetical protein
VGNICGRFRGKLWKGAEIWWSGVPGGPVVVETSR